eukprot:c21222_g1_i2.p1 GENE.c21222_g1_i2~~c21222_g1_i2.p1  ORF type:complete len:991 (+),score=396.11 c21222_g1_i2:28-3000(+)
MSSLDEIGEEPNFGLTIQECVGLCDEHGDGAFLKRFGGVEDVAKLLHVHDVRKGIEGDIEREVRNRQAKFGENKIPDPPRKSYFQILFEVLQDETMLVLIAAALVSLILAFVNVSANSPCSDFDPHKELVVDSGHGEQAWVEPIAILIAVIIVSNVATLNDYSKEKQFQKLNESSRNTVVIQVTRGGRRDDVMTQNLVVGDVVHLCAGAQIPTDGIVIDSQNMTCDESSLTGEADLKKKPKGTYLKCGALVNEGEGRMLVLCVGMNTDAGKAMSILAEEQDETPLQTKLNNIATFIGKIGMGVAILLFFSLSIRFAVCRNAATESFNASELQVALDYFILGVTIVVVAVPEGLPLAVTISLAYSMRRMMKDQNLVRKLAACETMGGATNICSDKTGTLTENRMTATEGVFLSRVVQSFPTQDTVYQQFNAKCKTFIETIIEGVATNTLETSFVQLSPNQLWEFKGNKTECALLVLSDDLGGNISALRDQYRELRARTLNFSYDRKRMTTVLKTANGFRVHTKGGSEIVLGLCTHYVNDTGDIVEFTKEKKEQMENEILRLTKCGLRTLCLAYKDASVDVIKPELLENMDPDEIESNLVALAIIGIKDPLRPSVLNAVKACKRAGITVRMVTGDNIETAKHIARECGILDEDGLSMEGSEFRELDPVARKNIIQKIQVLARSKPTDKFILVRTLRELGEVVAVTGDGTNDAPALKEADVGLAMGITGTDIAKKASDIIILDDNFASIVRSVMWGRNVYDSIRKFLQFQLTVNVAALVAAYIGAVANSKSPLTPVQLLWINLIMDTLAALALATEAPSVELLQRKPYGRFESLINPRMWLNIVGQAFLQVTILMIFLFDGENFLFVGSDYSAAVKTEKNYAMIFNTFVFLQLFNEFNARVLTRKLNVFEGIFGNPLFCGVIVITIFLQILLVEFAGDAFGTTPLTAEEFLICVAFGGLAIPLNLLLKQISVPDVLPDFRKKSEDKGISTLPS